MAEMRFIDPPEDGDIAEYYVRKCSHLHQNWDGFELWRKDGKYLYVWELSRIDLDLEMAYLLEVRDATGDDEMRDFMIVMAVGGGVTASRYGKPLVWSETDSLRVAEGLQWFVAETTRRLLPDAVEQNALANRDA